MKCPICKKVGTSPGNATVNLERCRLNLVVKAVPADICEIYAKEYIDEEATSEPLARLESEERAGTEINVRHYQAA